MASCYILHWRVACKSQIYHVYHCASLFQGCELYDISVLKSYIHVQKLDISHNEISGKQALLCTSSVLWHKVTHTFNLVL